MIVYGLANCDTCRKAVKTLAADDQNVRLHDIRAEPLSSERIAAFHAAFGDALVNRASATWRGLDAAERALPVPDLIARHPAVMKRPVIERNGELYHGFGAEVQGALMK